MRPNCLMFHFVLRHRVLLWQCIFHDAGEGLETPSDIKTHRGCHIEQYYIHISLVSHSSGPKNTTVKQRKYQINLEIHRALPPLHRLQTPSPQILKSRQRKLSSIINIRKLAHPQAPPYCLNHSNVRFAESIICPASMYCPISTITSA